MQPILVTGGAGFIGGGFVRQWLDEQAAPIVNLDALTYAGNLDSLTGYRERPAHHFVHGDIGDRELVRALLAEYQPRAIVHFAAESHVDRSIDGPTAFVETNVLGTVRLLEEVRKYWEQLRGEKRDSFRFLHVSTDEVFGALGPTGAFTEESPYAPNSPYSASKAASDHFVRAYHHTYGLPTLTTNCSNNYGPYQYPEKLIPLMILNCLEGKPLPVYGDGAQIRDWLHVADHCSAIQRVLQEGRIGETYAVGGNCERRNIDVVKTICRAVDAAMPSVRQGGCESLITHVQDRPGHDRRYAIDCRKISDELGWQPRHSFETGIAETVAWYISHRDWLDRLAAWEKNQKQDS
jgi:dTDP-glucose 4,6-dehydratase